MSAALKTRAVTASRVAPSRARVVRVSAQNQGSNALKVQIGAAALAAATLFSGVQASEAGVVYENTPQLKKLFQFEAGAAAPASDGALPVFGTKKSSPQSAPDVQVEAKSYVEMSTSGGIDPRVVALPVSIVGIAGLAFAFAKLDPGFFEYMDEAACKDSSDFVGYEQAVKGTVDGGAAAAWYEKGTKKTKAKTVKGKK